MSALHLRRDQFTAKPWKNGLGTTYDIALFPGGADHHTFEVRFALSPIVQDGIFSQFPGIERVITPIVGNGLHLGFDAHEVSIPRLTPYRFDTGLAPMGSLLDGAIEVINVMARRDAWRIESCGVTQAITQRLNGGEIRFVFALEAGVCVTVDEQVMTLAKHDALVVTGPAQVHMTCDAAHTALAAHLRRTDGGV